MNLPKKDKNGVSRLSYSQIATFKRSKKEFIDRYILCKPFEGNEYTEFGLKVGRALESNDFTEFSIMESGVLKSATRLDQFERMTTLKYDGFNVFGYIDTINNDLTHLIDYKTGGVGKAIKYKELDYTQLHLYALSIKQETGKAPLKAEVEFITRRGSAYKGQRLIVGDDPIERIDVDISEDRLKAVYWQTLKDAEEIERFYLNYINT